MSLVLAIVLEATALAGQRAYEVGVLDAGLLKLLPKPANSPRLLSITS